jgi:predicted CoA-binding protein
MQSPKNILENAKTILLIDWPNADVPRSLLKAGFIVYGYSPNKYSVIELDLGSNKNPDGTEKLIFSPLDKQPGTIDIVNIFRPEEEHAAK